MIYQAGNKRLQAINVDRLYRGKTHPFKGTGHVHGQMLFMFDAALVYWTIYDKMKHPPYVTLSDEMIRYMMELALEDYMANRSFDKLTRWLNEQGIEYLMNDLFVEVFSEFIWSMCGTVKRVYGEIPLICYYIQNKSVALWFKNPNNTTT